MRHDNRRVGFYQDPALIAKAAFASGLAYPLWRFVGPQGPHDPWVIWWIVGACHCVIAPAAWLFPSLRDRLLPLVAFYPPITALHWFGLAFANDMAPFYAVGSVMSVLTGPVVITKRPAFLVYVLAVAAGCVSLFIVAPDPLKIVYWGPMGMVLGLWYFRLAMQTRLAEQEERSRLELKEQVASRTEELSDANERLRRGIEERAVLEEQLRITQRMDAVGRLAGGVAHDFNNLLTAIQGHAELLMDALPADSKLRVDAEQIQQAGDRAASLTEQLLTLGRSHPIQTAVLNVDVVIRGMAPLLCSVLGEQVEAETRLHTEKCWVRGNRNQFEQIVLNLAMNARDAMPAGGKVVIETEEIRRSHLDSHEILGAMDYEDYVRLSVTDTGEGMDEAIRSRVFEPFFTTKEVGSGTGLGLSSVYGVVQRAGGFVRVESRLGAGSRFEVYWPSLGEVAVEDAQSPPANPSVPRGNERILLVEDDPIVRRLSERILAGLGYEVTVATGGKDAVAAIEQRPEDFDLVLTDVVMPQMSGIELVDLLSRSHPHLHFLYMSGNLDFPSLQQRDLPDEADVLHKPFTVSDLATSVRAALER